MPNDDDDGLARHLMALRRYARRLVRDPAEADDLVQETLVRVLARARTGRRRQAGIRHLRAYLCTTLRHLRATELAAKAARGRLVPLDDVDHAVGSPPSQQVSVEWRELGRLVGSMPAELRQALILVGLEGRTHGGAASFADIPSGTMMSRLFRARAIVDLYLRDGMWTDGRPARAGATRRGSTRRPRR